MKSILNYCIFLKSYSWESKRAYPVKADEKKEESSNSRSSGGSGISAFCLLREKLTRV